MDELVVALERYIDCLQKEVDELVRLAFVHGWRSSRYEEGITLRKDIEEAKTKLGIFP